MDERVEAKPPKMSWKTENSKIALPEYDLDELKKNPQLLMSPKSLSRMTKSASTKSNCLCSPTTHIGSFRCRYHRNGSLARGGSVGSNLSDLASKSEAIGESL